MNSFISTENRERNHNKCLGTHCDKVETGVKTPLVDYWLTTNSQLT